MSSLFSFILHAILIVHSLRGYALLRSNNILITDKTNVLNYSNTNNAMLTSMSLGQKLKKT